MIKASPARLVATRVLHRIAVDGAWAMPALDAEIRAARLDRRDAGLATEIVYGALRVLPAIDAALARHLSKPKKTDPYLMAALRAGAYQLLYLSRAPAHAVVSDAVTIARNERGPRLAGVANAVLRKVASGREDAAARPDRLVLPEWLVASLRAALGPERAEAFLVARRLPPPLGLRATGDRDALLEALRAARPEAEIEAVGPRGLSLRGAGDPRALPGFAEGRFAVQELGAQRVVEHVGVEAGDHVADLACGHGSKTLALAEEVGERGHVVAVDLYEEKLARLEAERRRLRVPDGRIEAHAVDLTVGRGGLPERGFDRVLLDAPCTGIGTVHRRPELLLRLTPEDPARLAVLQRALLESALRLVRPDGALIYAVCSPTIEEGEQVIDAFERAHPSLVRESAEAIGPWEGDLDAYRVVRWRCALGEGERGARSESAAG